MRIRNVIFGCLILLAICELCVFLVATPLSWMAMAMTAMYPDTDMDYDRD